MTYPCWQVGDIANPKGDDPTYQTAEKALDVAMALSKRNKEVYCGIWYTRDDMDVLPKLVYIVSYRHGIFERRV